MDGIELDSRWCEVAPGLYVARVSEEERRRRYRLTPAFVAEARQNSPAPDLFDEVIRMYEEGAGKILC